jgi:hypothetical protein
MAANKMASSPAMELEDAKGRHENAIAMERLSATSSPAVKATLKKEVEETKLELEKVKGKKPEDTRTRLHILDAIEFAQKEAKARAKSAANATANAKQVHDQSLEVMEKQVKAMKQMMEEMSSRFSDTQEQWRERHLAVASESSALIKELQQRLAELEMGADAVESSQEELHHDAQNATSEVAAAEAALALTTSTAAFNVVAEEADLDSLPDFEPDAPQLIACAKMYHVLQQWETGGCMHFFTFKQLNEWCETQESMALAKELLGPTWQLWFGSGTQEDTVIPRQTVIFLAKASIKLRNNYDASQLSENAAQAKVHYSAMKQKSKAKGGVIRSVTKA